MADGYTPTNTAWSEDEHGAAQIMWADGLSGSEIAARLGRSRSSVLGYMNRRRDDFPARRGSHIVHAPKKKPRERQYFKPTANPTSKPTRKLAVPASKKRYPSAPVPEPTPKNITLLDLKMRQCHWPVKGAKAETLFCGHPTVEGRSFCLHHCQRAYVRPI